MQQKLEAFPNPTDILGNLERLQAGNEPEECSDDADPGEDARQVLEELCPQAIVDKLLSAEKRLCRYGGAPSNDHSLAVAPPFLLVKRVAELLPQVGELLVALKDLLQVPGTARLLISERLEAPAESKAQSQARQQE